MHHSRLAGGLAVLAVFLVLLVGTPVVSAATLPSAHPGVVKIAQRYLGVPYVAGGMSAKGVDAPGLTKLVYRKAGMWLPRGIRAQAAHGVRLTRSQTSPGDLVFDAYYQHVGIYVGGDSMIDAPGPGTVVRYSTVDWSAGVHVRRYDAATGYHAARVARRYLGVPYVFGGASPSGFDASGLTMYVYAQLGAALVHGATEQQKASIRIPLRNLKRGDLVFFGTKSYSDHVGIYVGDGRMIHAPHAGAVVSYGSIEGARIGGRLLPAR